MGDAAFCESGARWFGEIGNVKLETLDGLTILDDMEAVTPKGGYARKFTDAELRDCLARGLKPAEIARKYGVTRQAISLRVKQLDLTTASAAVAPEESRRYVRRQIDVMEQLGLNVHRANLLMDACDRWLRDADDEERYDIGARADEVVVTYVRQIDGKEVRSKATLSDLLRRVEAPQQVRPGLPQPARLSVEAAESKHADPRELILRTQQETRQTVGLVADLMQKILDARILEAFRVAVLEEIREESPDCAQRIAERLARTITLHAAFAGSGAVPAGNGEPN